MAQRKQTRKKQKYNGYTATEQDMLTFAQWCLMIAFVFLVIAAIITGSTKLMYYSIAIGILIAYGVYKHWFDA